MRRRPQKRQTYSETYELKIDKVVPGGKGMGFLNEKVVFVPDTLPGETHKIRFTKSKKDFAEAISLEVIHPSPNRIAPPCKKYHECGGCDFQFTTYEKQLELKLGMIRDSFSRLAKYELPTNFSIMASPEKWSYRTRARLSYFAPKNILGFKQKQGNRIINLSSCPILSEDLSKVLGERKDLSENDREVSLQSNGTKFIQDLDQIISIKVKDKLFKVRTSVFFQSNLTILPSFLEWVIDRFPQGRVALDLFSGVGFFAAFMEDYFETVIAVERNKGCLELAQQNLTTKTQFYTGDVSDWVQGDFYPDIDFLIVDPPREGIDQMVIQQIHKWKPNSWVYISCNPVTLARDLKLILTLNEYEVKESKAFDFYPQTSHCEMAIEFIRK